MIVASPVLPLVSVRESGAVCSEAGDAPLVPDHEREERAQ